MMIIPPIIILIKTLKKCEKLQNELPPDDQSECSRGLVVHSYSPFTQCLCTAQCTHCALQ